MVNMAAPKDGPTGIEKAHRVQHARHSLNDPSRTLGHGQARLESEA